MAKEKFIVTGEQRDDIDGQMLDIKRQLRLKNGSPLDPELVKTALQNIVEGVFIQQKISQGLLGVDKTEDSGQVLTNLVFKQRVTAIAEDFVVAEKFVIDVSEKAKVKIININQGFFDIFSNKIEESLTERDFPVCGYILLKNSKRSDGYHILHEIGEHKKAIMSLSEIYCLLETQPNGEQGLLLNNGFSNIFYVQNVIPYEILVYWSNGGWNIHLSVVLTEYSLPLGTQIIFHEKY